jgi:SSS family solute:Na+ symporter
MIWTDVLQCLLLLVGVLMVIFYVMIVDQTGPVEWWATAAKHAPNHVAPPFFSWDLTVRDTVVVVLLGNFFWTICTHGSDQVVLQRYFSTASQKAARRSYLINVAVDLLMAALLATSGLALLAFYLRHGELLPAGWTVTEQADKLFPHFLGHQLPAGCAGLIIAAFICDAMQTLESGVNSITAVVTNDIVPRLRQGRPRVLNELTFARVLTVVVTLLVTANAYFVTRLSLTSDLTLISMMPKFFNLFVGPLSALFFIGMFLPRCTARSALGAVVTGLTASIFWSWYREIFGVERGPTIFLAIAVPWFTSVATAFVLSFLIERGGAHAGQGFTWFAIVKGPPLEEPASKVG